MVQAPKQDVLVPKIASINPKPITTTRTTAVVPFGALFSESHGHDII